MSLYVLRGVTKNYGEIKAIRGIDLEISDEILGIIGYSGVGKTTLLKILAGLETPTQGTVEYKDTLITPDNVRVLRKNATMIFQTPKFLRGDVYTNIAYGLRLRKIPEQEIRERVEKTLDEVRLSGFETRYARNLSGGEQQRIALARALVLDPEVLLLDEPTSNLDSGNASIINDILREESKSRIVIIATHDLPQVQNLADRVLFLENGVIMEEGIPEKVEAMTRFTENIFPGITTIKEGVNVVNVNGVGIKFTEPAVGRVTVHVRPQDIIISKETFESSARNQFVGSIVGIEEKNGVVLVSVDAGIIFKVQITRKSFDKMGLNLGDEINITFKASSVILL
ncbi:MAG: ABC transporter ATP-binding protein [archaeon]